MLKIVRTKPLNLVHRITTAVGLSAVLYLAQAPAQQAAPQAITLPPLAVGDWVFRAGTSAESRLIQQLSNSEFSHIGMVVSLQPEALIVHATTDDDPSQSNQILASTLSAFISPQLARSFAIARPQFVSQAEKQQAAAWLLQQLQQPFILAERNQPHRYCTTLLVDALQHTQQPFQPNWQQINAPMFRGEYLFPNAFANYPQIEWLYHSETSR